jgi:SPP1 gp7 family putative phage head morphogenesis protein
VGDGTQNTVMTIVREGSTKGLSNDEVATKLRQFREFQTTGRAERVARTEMTAAANQGSVESFKQAEIEMKAWYTALDGRERPSHAAAHGQIRKTGELFEVGFDKMEAPGQGSSARENVNCRCVVLPVEDEEAAEELRDQIGEVPEIPEVVDKLPELDPGVLENWTPEVQRTAGVSAGAAQATSNAVAQTARSLRPGLGEKMMKMWKNPDRRVQVIKPGSNRLKLRHPKTGKPMRASGVYYPPEMAKYGTKGVVDKAWVSSDTPAWATHHELAHQLMGQHAGHIRQRMVQFLGKRRGQAFWNRATKMYGEVAAGKRRAITDYSTSNINEYLAENFKYAITAPNHLKAVDPDMLKLMRRYWIKERPAPLHTSAGPAFEITSPANPTWGSHADYAIKGVLKKPRAWASAYIARRRERTWLNTKSPR